MATISGARAGVGRLLAAALLSASCLSCTAFERYTFADPTGEVSLIGEPEAVRSSPSPTVPRDFPYSDCPVGATIYWGRVKNTGDVDVEDVKIVIDVFDAAGTLLGRFVDSIYNGVISEDLDQNPNPGVDLEVEQSGDFSVCCSSVPFGTAARATFRTEFLVPDFDEGS